MGKKVIYLHISLISDLIALKMWIEDLLEEEHNNGVIHLDRVKKVADYSAIICERLQDKVNQFN